MIPEGISILVVDDDQIVLKGLSEYLRVEGCYVRSVQTLKEAIDTLAQEQFRVVICDVRLPAGSGFDLLDHIRAYHLSSAVIMLTGYGTIEDAVHAIRLGAYDYVTKPISDDDVRLTIERALRQQELLEENRRLMLIGKIAEKVAHELNNPLDGILRFVNLAMRQLDKPEQARSYLEEGRNGLLRMSNILSELLAFSRGRREASKLTSLSQVIRHSLAHYEQRAHQTNIRIELDVPPDLPVCASNDMWEVLANVVKNALDAMGEEGILAVSARCDGNSVKISVADTGPGVPAGLRDKIFEPFFTTKKSGLGTGLGLALCRDSLRRIGGEIRLVPSARGAKFEIDIPVEQHSE